jgi:hypothetical protein
LFTFREAGKQVPLVTMLHPSLRNIALPPCLPLGIKDSLKVFLMGEIAEGKLLEGGLLKGENELLEGKEFLKGNC